MKFKEFHKPCCEEEINAVIFAEDLNWDIINGRNTITNREFLSIHTMNFIKILWITLGTLSLLIGIVGIVVPGLPTTPFLLLTAALYVRSSEKLYNKLIAHKHLGKFILDFQAGKGIPLKTKIISLIMMWTMITLSCSFFLELIWIRVLVIFVGIIGSVVMFFVLPTSNESGNV